ncbi:MAG TPA: hypothetical protein VHD90_24370 [Phototrophicaceae bacterium]|nr:hypothetical protein [Phototrophicaceae bacterium]
MIHISAVTLLSGDAYALQLGESVTVERLARYLAQYYAQDGEHLSLELAQPVLPRHRVDEIDLQSGDRLLILDRALRQSDLPDALGPTKKALSFVGGDYHVESRGKRRLLLGKPDIAHGIVPDIDARFFISPQFIDYISRSCLRFDFDAAAQRWYVVKTGATRVLMDDYELGSEPVPVDSNTWLNFYRATDEPRSPVARSLGEVRLLVEDVPSPGREIVGLERGGYGLVAVVGAEKENRHLSVNATITAETIAERLAEREHTPLTEGYRLYILRLISPRTPLGTLRLADDQFLYFGTPTNYAQNALILREARHPESVYVLNAGEDKVIGYRGRMETFEPSLHVDLYDFMLQQQLDPPAPNGAPQYLAWVSCRASDNTWWIVTAVSSSMAIYLNNRKLSAGEAAQVLTGDVITFSVGSGAGFENYFARFEIEIATRAYNAVQHTVIS